MANISADKLAKEIEATLKHYTSDVAEAVKEATDEVAKDARKKLQSISPSKTGSYKKGWKVKAVYQSATEKRVVIYNKKKPGLVHLLEDGHNVVTVNRKLVGRSKKYTHVAPTRKIAERELEQKIVEAIERTYAK